MLSPRITAIGDKIARYDLAMKPVSERAGLGPTFVRDMLKRGRGPSAENLDAVERALEEMIAAKVGGETRNEVRPADAQLPSGAVLPKDIPVLGTAAGAAIGRGAFTLFREPVDFVLRPPGLLAAKGIYALYVENSSMEPRFEHGELIYVNPFRPAQIGDYVVIQEPIGGDDDEYSAYVKRLVRRGAEWIETQQLNPVATIKFKNSAGLRIHKVMTWAELFGV